MKQLIIGLLVIINVNVVYCQELIDINHQFSFNFGYSIPFNNYSSKEPTFQSGRANIGYNLNLEYGYNFYSNYNLKVGFMHFSNSIDNSSLINFLKQSFDIFYDDYEVNNNYYKSNSLYILLSYHHNFNSFNINVGFGLGIADLYYPEIEYSILNGNQWGTVKQVGSNDMATAYYIKAEADYSIFRNISLSSSGMFQFSKHTFENRYTSNNISIINDPLNIEVSVFNLNVGLKFHF